MDSDKKKRKKPCKTTLYNVDIDPETKEIIYTEVKPSKNALTLEQIAEMVAPQNNGAVKYLNDIRENSPILKRRDLMGVYKSDLMQFGKFNQSITNSLKDFIPTQLMDFGLDYLSFRKTLGLDKDFQKAGEIMTSFVSVQQSAFAFFKRVEVWRSVVEPLVNNGAVKYIKELQEDVKALQEEREMVESTTWHQLTVEYYEFELDQQNRELEQKSADIIAKDEKIQLLERALVESNIANQKLKQISAGLVSTDKESHKTVSLRPNITPSQIIRLHSSFEWLFSATLDQWRNVLSEDDIREAESPILLESDCLSDIAIFFHYLEKNGLITSRRYPSIIDSKNLFKYAGRVVTVKQIKKPKENTNWPDIGRNYPQIKESIEKIAASRL